MWCDESLVDVEWDNREQRFEGSPVWSASHGTFQLGREAFRVEVLSLHNRLINQMNERVKKVGTKVLRSDIQVDISALLTEHEQRSRTIQAALKEPVLATNWQAVSEAVREIERAGM